MFSLCSTGCRVRGCQVVKECGRFGLQFLHQLSLRYERVEVTSQRTLLSPDSFPGRSPARWPVAGERAADERTAMLQAQRNRLLHANK